MRNIFVAEDELIIALLYQHYFEKKGYKILGPFVSGKEAMDNFEGKECKLALLDIQLEDHISGIEVAEYIRTISDIPIVFTTGNETRKTLANTQHLNNVYVVPKPIDFQRILEILESNL